MVEMHCQISVNNINKSYIVISIRYNQETFIYPDPDTTLPSNNISDETVKIINRIFWNNEVVAIWRLKNGDIVITFKEEMIEYKKGDD